MLFTGDLVQSGESAQFEKMQAEVLDPLWERLRELGSGDAVLLAVPGNHDLYRPNPNEDNAAIDALLKKDGFQDIAAKFWDRPAGPLFSNWPAVTMRGRACGGDLYRVALAGVGRGSGRVE